MKNRLLLLVTGALLASHRPALAQAPQSPTEGMYVQLGWTVGQVNYTTPYRGEPASQFAVGQPFMRYTSYGKKSLVLADVSGMADAVRGGVKQLANKGSGSGYLTSHVVRDAPDSYGYDICVGSLAIAGGSKHLLVGGQVSFNEFGLKSYSIPGTTKTTNPGVINDNLEALVGGNVHFVSTLGKSSHLRVSLFGDRIFHYSGVRGYAATGEAELLLHLTGRLNLLAHYQVRERFYAGQHTGDLSAFSTTPNVIYPLASVTDKLPVRALTNALTVGLAFHVGY